MVKVSVGGEGAIISTSLIISFVQIKVGLVTDKSNGMNLNLDDGGQYVFTTTYYSFRFMYLGVTVYFLHRCCWFSPQCSVASGVDAEIGS